MESHQWFAELSVVYMDPQQLSGIPDGVLSESSAGKAPIEIKVVMEEKDYIPHHGMGLAPIRSMFLGEKHARVNHMLTATCTAVWLLEQVGSKFSLDLQD